MKTSHQLARELLNLPDVPVKIHLWPTEVPPEASMIYGETKVWIKPEYQDWKVEVPQ